MEYVIGALIGVLLGGIGVFGFLHFSGKNMIAQAKTIAEQFKRQSQLEADNKAREIELAAQQKAMKLKETFEQDQHNSRRKLAEHESRLEKRETILDRKLDTLTMKERNLDDLATKLASQKKKIADGELELAGLLKEERDRLLNITSLSPDQAKELLFKRLENECRGEVGEIVQRFVQQAEEEGKDKARQIILGAIQRYAADQTADH
ncbi:MAG: DUF3552 domain-containing protein, partial [Burkholderiales bacterium]|nr:DUF3552 domain-containing protein [Phycisphaerae bacterium]